MKILLTGCGSFGTAFVLRHHPHHTIRVFSRSEYGQSLLRAQIPTVADVRFLLGDVRDMDRLRRAAHGVDLIVHSAAQKRVDSCRYDPGEATKTNTIGSQNVADLGPRAILISSDKAVQPVNEYGFSKALAERIFLNAGHTVVRYGNVLGSRGSVTELWRQVGGEFWDVPIKVTDPEMTRFWLTQDQAQDLVGKTMQGLNATTSYARDGLVVPRPPSSTVGELAEALYPGRSLKIIGPRPGEKHHETLLTESENDGVEFRSDTNPRRIGVAELRVLLGADGQGNAALGEHLEQRPAAVAGTDLR